jgi:hypothetical protein
MLQRAQGVGRHKGTTKAKGNRNDRHECPRFNKSASGDRGEAQGICEVVRGGRGEDQERI